MSEQQSQDPSERPLPSLSGHAAQELARFVLRHSSPFPALEELRLARDAAIRARAAIGKSLAEAAIAARLDATITDLRELVYAARLALAVSG